MTARLALIALASLLCSTPAFAQAASPVTARSAYDAKDWKTCARLYVVLADLPVPRPGTSFRSAECLAMSGDLDAALTKLGKFSVVDLGALDQPIADLLASSTLDPLHPDPRWLPLKGRLEAEQAARQARYDTPLRQALAIRVNKDQDIRNRLNKEPENKELLEEVTSIDADNLVWLKQILDQQGWPKISQVGPDGAGSFWLLAQHADSDPAFQERVLSLMKPLVSQGEAIGYQLAYLTDRVRRARDEPQIYGTQLEIVNDRIVPQTLQSPEDVDARRAAVGLGPLSEYISANEANHHSQDP